MRTFFAIVKDLDMPEAADEGDPDPAILWFGGMFDEIKEVHGLVAGLAPYADLTIATVQQLNADRSVEA